MAPLPERREQPAARSHASPGRALSVKRDHESRLLYLSCLAWLAPICCRALRARGCAVLAWRSSRVRGK